MAKDDDIGTIARKANIELAKAARSNLIKLPVGRKKTQDKDLAFACERCGSVCWHIRRNFMLECVECGSVIENVRWSIIDGQDH